MKSAVDESVGSAAKYCFVNDGHTVKVDGATLRFARLHLVIILMLVK